MKEPYFTIFCGKLCRIRQDHAEPGEEQDHGSDRKWWKGYSNQLPSTIALMQKIHTVGFQGRLISRVDTQQLLSTRRSSHGAHGDTGVGHIHRIAPIE